MWYSYIRAEQKDSNCVMAQITTGPHSPWFSGHFPDDPILPGVAQIHMVAASIAKVLQKELVLQSVARIKFRKLIRPGDVLDIHAETGKKEYHYSFQITSKQQEVCSGRLVLAPKKEQ
jgi:3-hydroxyacyl-[acyl-carrier-protein] dehydratase